jgi:hypothetical protein
MNRRKRRVHKKPESEQPTSTLPEVETTETPASVAEPPLVQDEYANVVRFPTMRYHDTLGEIEIPNASRKGRQFDCIEDLRAAGTGWKRSPWPIADKQ